MGYLHFFDDWKLIGYQNLERRMGRPSYVPEATLEDELCEGSYDFPCVARLPEGRYVALYTAAVPSDRVPDFKSFTIPKATFQKSKSRMPIYCYAVADPLRPDVLRLAEWSDRRRPLLQLRRQPLQPHLPPSLHRTQRARRPRRRLVDQVWPFGWRHARSS